MKSMNYKIYLILLAIATAIIVFTNPDIPGFYIQPLQVLPLVFALPFFLPFKFLKWNEPVRKNAVHSVYAFSLIQALGIIADYIANTHVGLIQLALCALPSLAIWIFRFIRWNVRCFKNKECRTAAALCSIAWGFFAFAYPPLPLGPAALVLLVPWFLVLAKHSPKAAIFGTYWSGMLFNVISFWWIYNVMAVGPSGIIFFGLFLAFCFFTSYNIAGATLFIWARDKRIFGKRIFLALFPFAWAGLEMTRTVTELAFPWTHLGYTLGNQLQVLQLLPYIGIFGYTVIVLYCNMLVAHAILKKRYKLCAIPVLIFGALFIQGTIVLSSESAKPFHENEGEDSPTISLIQPSVPQTDKWNYDYLDSVTTKTFQFAEDSVTSKTDIIAFAETAIPDHISRQPGMQQRLRDLAIKNDATVIIGALDHERIPDSLRIFKKYKVFNAAFSFTPGKHKYERYVKKHLVPFSEKVPFEKYLKILSYVDFGESDFVPGTETPVYKPFFWTPFICYDAIFGDIIRDAIRKGSRMMLNITNDGWFGRSPAPYNHINIIRYRAIEHAYPVARVANTGVSGFIDQYGNYYDNTKIFTDRVLTGKVPLRSHDTLYTHIGDYIESGLLWFLLLYIASLSIFSIYKKKTA